jgi:hypothetical protein
VGLLVLPLALFGYGQGLVMAPLFDVALISVRNGNAGAGGGILSTMQQIANGVGVALLGAIYFTVRAAYSDRVAVLATLLVGASADWRRQRCCGTWDAPPAHSFNPYERGCVPAVAARAVSEVASVVILCSEPRITGAFSRCGGSTDDFT